jgi:hypothetical protein
MELTIASYRIQIQRRDKPRAPKPPLDIERVIRANQARQTYERLKFQALQRNLTNPLFNDSL